MADSGKTKSESLIITAVVAVALVAGFAALSMPAHAAGKLGLSFARTGLGSTGLPVLVDSDYDAHRKRLCRPYKLNRWNRLTGKMERVVRRRCYWEIR